MPVIILTKLFKVYQSFYEKKKTQNKKNYKYENKVCVKER